MRSAPRNPVGLTAKPHEFQVPLTVQVIEPDDQHPLPALPSHSVSSLLSTRLDPLSPSYRIPRSILSSSHEPRIHRLSKNKAAVLADKVAKRELRQNRKANSRSKQFCSLCKIRCNSRKVFVDHISSRGHRTKRESKARAPRCYTHNRKFESHDHLKRRRRGAAHFK